MRRKKKVEEHENHERWLVSYADFITLLFAFFVVMYSISSVNEGKYKVLSDSIGSAFTGTLTAKSGDGVLDGSVAPKMLVEQVRHAELLLKEKRNLARIAANIQKVLNPLVLAGKIKVTQGALGVSVEINSSVLFNAGAAHLSSESAQIVESLALVLKDEPHLLLIEGHTDSFPISNQIFASNWELSSGRASSVARVLSGSGIDPVRMTVLGHAANKPVVGNETPEGRVRNRRVIVMVLPNRS